ncbi:MAG: phosphatase PAP2-related protein [Bacteroidia bacterium]|nr:phosphatase PAP2-related protein [Bacteroidia bacterium]
MDQIKTEKRKVGSFISEAVTYLLPVLKSKYFYIGLVSLIFGACLNFASQTYLHHSMSEGKTLPMLSDLILDNVPVIDVSLIYDLFSLVVLAVVVIYLVHKKEINRLPYILLLCGIFYIIRGIFIVLTPFGNPPEFPGSDPLFNGFSLYELGVYPSGHVGDSFLLLLLVNDKVYKYILSFCLAVIIITLIFAHSHYSIDILSGFFFAYAIKAFGDKYLTSFDLGISQNSKD